MREQLIEALTRELDAMAYEDGIVWNPKAERLLDRALVFLTEHADEWMVEAGREWCDYSHWISEPEDLLAVLSADREDADGVS